MPLKPDPNSNRSAKKRKRLSGDFNHHVPNPHLNSSSPREDIMSGNQYRGRSPLRRRGSFRDGRDGPPEKFRFNSDRSRRTDSRSPRDRPNDYDRYEAREYGPPLEALGVEVYRPDYSSNIRGARYSSPSRPLRHTRGKFTDPAAFYLSFSELKI
jgi:hypothetical protein